MGLVIAVVLGGALLLIPGGMLLSAFRSRRQFAALPGTFRCKIRTDTPGAGEPPARWPRGISRAVWVHDSLVAQQGRWHTRVELLAVHFAEGAVDTTTAREISGLGSNPVL